MKTKFLSARTGSRKNTAECAWRCQPRRLFSPFFLVAGFVLAACSAPQPPAPQPPAVLVRETGGAAGVAGMQVYAGEIRARYETDLGFRIGGKIIERMVDVGATVGRGQTLARLDPQDTRLAADAATAQVAAAEADAALARAELVRAESLRASNFISGSALDGRRSVLQAAEARLRQARAQATAAANQAGYSALQTDHGGVVTAVLAETGQVVAAGQPVLRVARPEEREVQIYVPESRIQGIAPGNAARITPWADAQRVYAGTVREVSPAADVATRTYTVRVSVTGADDALRLGATANVFFDRTAGGEAIVPLPAVSRTGNDAVIWVVDGADTLRRLPVQVVAFREDGAVLGGALPAGTRIVIAGVHKLVEGERVRPVAEDAPVALDVRR